MSTYLGDVVRSNRCGRYRLSRWQVPESRLAKEADKMTRISIPHSIRTEKGDQRKLVQSQFRVYFFGRKEKKSKIKFSGVSIFLRIRAENLKVHLALVVDVHALES